MDTETAPRYIPKALFREREKPLLIWIAPPFLIVTGILPLLFLSLIVSQTLGEDGTVQQKLKHLSVPILFGIIGSVMNLAGAYGLMQEKTWARPLLTWWSLALTVVCVPLAIATHTTADLDLTETIVWQALTFWYFYRYDRVTAYYARLEERESTRQTT